MGESTSARWWEVIASAFLGAIFGAALTVLVQSWREKVVRGARKRLLLRRVRAELEFVRKPDFLQSHCLVPTHALQLLLEGDLLDPDREPLLLEALMDYASAAWDFNKSILGSDESFQTLCGRVTDQAGRLHTVIDD
ncbi:MAG TPA: hypothetical protein GX513_09775 [Firmicutes bacterium]|nr:hypothetical protein [Bacillota bacterium]